LKLTHPDVGYSQAEDLMLVAEGAVEIRVLRRRGELRGGGEWIPTSGTG